MNWKINGSIFSSNDKFFTIDLKIIDCITVEHNSIVIYKKSGETIRNSLYDSTEMFEDLTAALEAYSLKNIKKKKTKKQDCVVCFEEIRELYTIVPCGHTNLCCSCYTNINKCPTCREDIDNFIKLF